MFKIPIGRLIKKDYQQTKIIICFVLGMVLIIYGIDLFWRGVHNVDLVYNAQHILCRYNETIDDWYDQYNLRGDRISLKNLYLLGFGQIIKAFYMVMMGGVLLGSSLRNIDFK